MKKNNKKKKSIFELNVSIGGTGLTQRALFAKHLSVMLKAGLTITDALKISADSAQGSLKKILSGVLKSTTAGHSLSESFALYPKFFSGLFISATQAGESSGTLEENLENVAKQLEKEKELVAKIKGAMLYPIVVLVAAFILGLGVAFFILPKITPLFEGMRMELPAATRGLIWFSNLIQNHGIYLIIGIVVVIVVIAWLVRQKFSHPFTHWLFLHLPVIKKISKNTNLARFCLTLGTLLKSGLNIDEAMQITQTTVGNYYYVRALTAINSRVRKGTKLSKNLEQYKDLFPVMVSRMIKVGEESGGLEETLLYLANFYEVEVETSTKSLSTIIEPILLIVIGLIVGFLALSIITPIYNITGNVSR